MAEAVDLSVDIETGHIVVHDVVVASDVGRIINRAGFVLKRLLGRFVGGAGVFDHLVDMRACHFVQRDRLAHHQSEHVQNHRPAHCQWRVVIARVLIAGPGEINLRCSAVPVHAHRHADGLACVHGIGEFPILQIRNIRKGESLGYNASYIAPRDMQIAVIGAGYADGVPVLASNKGFATLHDEAVPIVGRVSMDSTIVDITDVHMHKEVGGVVVFRGDQLENEAREIGTINYEMLTRMGQRLRRDYGKPEKKEPDTRPKGSSQSSRPQNKPFNKASGSKPGFKKGGYQKRR